MSNISFCPRVNVGSTAIHEQLRAPYGLSEHQRVEISEMLQEVDKDLDAYETEIHLHEAKLVFLRSQRERLLDHKFSLSSLLSRIHRLPNELLARIFVLACENNELVWYSRTPGDALSISAVCSRWRSLAISCSEVWSKFTINLGPDNGFHENLSRRLERLLDIHLERSKQRLLSLTIQSAWMYDEDEDDAVKEDPLLQKLIETSPRWQHATIEVMHFSSGYHPSLDALNLPALETLSIQQYRCHRPAELHLLSSAARLRTLSVGYCDPTNADAPLLNHITSLELTPKLDTFSKLLDLCPSLQNLKLRPYFMRTDELGLSRHTVPISSLCVLFGDGVKAERGMLAIAMDSLTAPSLSSLALREMPDFNDSEHNAGVGARWSPFKQIDAFLERSGCALTTLELTNLSISDREVVALLKRLRSLLDLKITDPGRHPERYTLPVTKALVESFHSHRKTSLQSAVQPIVPRLQSLYLAAQSSTFDYTSFISTVQSRWIPDPAYASKIGISCLRSVELRLPSGLLNEEECLPLKHLEKSGMRVVVGKCRPNYFLYD